MPVLSYRVGPVCRRRLRLLGGCDRLLDARQHERGGINGVKLAWEKCETEYNASKGVECYERLKKKGRRRHDRRAAVHRDYLLASSTGSRRTRFRSSPSATALATPPTGASSPRFSRWSPPTGARSAGDDQVHRQEGRRHRQAERQEDRAPLPRLGIRQGTHSGARRAATSCGFDINQIPVAAPGQSRNRSGCRSARSSPTT